MKKNDCDIVQDLLPSYEQGVVHESSKEFIREHLKTCEKCKEMLEIIKEEEKKDAEKEKIKEKFEINYLLKLKRGSLKSVIIATIALVLVLIICVLQPLYTKAIVRKMDSKIAEVENNNNFKVIINYKDLRNGREYEEYYYFKDGKYKIKNYVYPALDGVLYYYTYGEQGNENVMTVFEHKKLIIKEKRGDQDQKNSKHIISMFSYIMNRYPIGTRVKNTKYEGKNCYLISRGFGDNYSNLWVDKETMLPIKSTSSWVNSTKETNPSSGYYKKEVETCPEEKYYKIEYGTVTDEDLEKPNEESYTVEEY